MKVHNYRYIDLNFFFHILLNEISLNITQASTICIKKNFRKKNKKNKKTKKNKKNKKKQTKKTPKKQKKKNPKNRPRKTRENNWNAPANKKKQKRQKGDTPPLIRIGISGFFSFSRLIIYLMWIAAQFSLFRDGLFFRRKPYWPFDFKRSKNARWWGLPREKEHLVRFVFRRKRKSIAHPS